jgi:hypothetical protein
MHKTARQDRARAAQRWGWDFNPTLYIFRLPIVFKLLLENVNHYQAKSDCGEAKIFDNVRFRQFDCDAPCEAQAIRAKVNTLRE